MKLRRGWVLVFICALLPLCRLGAQAIRKFDVYFVSIGSGWYLSSAASGLEGFSRIAGANQSASMVADTLLRGGAAFGVKVTSDDHRVVTLDDIEKAMQQVESRIAAAKPRRPLFVFYFAGHGMSEGIAWSHFSIPGDFAYRGDATDLDLEGLSNSTLYAGTLVDELGKLHIPFLVILDTCYDGKEKRFESPALTAVATRNLRDIGGVLRALNEFRDTYPVLFAASPGKSVATVENPLQPDSDVSIAPLARRLILSVGPALDAKRSVSLAQFIDRMTSTNLDRLTEPAVTHSPVPNGSDDAFLVPTASTDLNRPLVSSIGTGNRVKICCGAVSSVAKLVPTPSAGYSAKLSISGETGEYISAGDTLVFASPPAKVTVHQQGPGNISVRFERGETEFDASFSTPSGEAFVIREYQAAQRYNMADAGHPGLEVSGDGRGCGDVSGAFKVNEIAYAGDGSISRLSATFSQLCDQAKTPARGSIEMTRK